ncbi:MAG TPA: hypothetical protein VI078_05645 [bacterium]
MSAKKNCWEVHQCGREIGGVHVRHLGICPAATNRNLDGVHGGKNAGRSCWVVAGTLCGGAVQAAFANKFKNCQECDFYKSVQREESGRFQMSIVLLNRLREVQV